MPKFKTPKFKTIVSVTMLLLFVFINTERTSSQTIFGMNISDPNDTTGFMYNNSLDAIGSDIYVKIDSGIFDRVLLHKGIGFVYTVNHPNSNRFNQIRDEIVTNFGYESDTFDTIPQGAVAGDMFDIIDLIWKGEARIIRYWYEKKFNIKLDFSRKNLEVFISYF